MARSSGRSGANGGGGTGGANGGGWSGSPATNAALIASALAYGLWALVDRGRVSWPPRELLAAGTTFAGCLAVVGPLVVGRRDNGQAGLGDVLWLAGGLLIWVFDLAAIARGRTGARGFSWTSPIDATTMGLFLLAVGLATVRARITVKSWSWTNVIGILLSLFWIGSALAGYWPSPGNGFVSR